MLETQKTTNKQTNNQSCFWEISWRCESIDPHQKKQKKQKERARVQRRAQCRLIVEMLRLYTRRSPILYSLRSLYKRTMASQTPLHVTPSASVAAAAATTVAVTGTVAAGAVSSSSSSLSSHSQHDVMTSQHFPLNKIVTGVKTDKSESKTSTSNRDAIVLVSCGSFNPITFLHLRLFESARNFLQSESKLFVPCGVVSPVHAEYQMHKPSLTTTAADRLRMSELATQTSTWIGVSSWEASQTGWSETAKVLAAHQHFFSQELEPLLGGGKVHVRLLCGSDILQSSLNKELWSPDDLEKIYGRFGVVCLERAGYNARHVIDSNPALSQYSDNIFVVPQCVENNISSTIVRDEVSRGHSVKYLVPDAVEQYIREKHMFQKQ
jgi:nicotinamide mononucleotide adenylyltransferase